jgi:LAO/AO transport system kinase
MADVTMVVLVPEWGDSIQTIKAGLLEIGDIFVVNKSDREGAAALLGELRNMLQMANKDATPLLLTNHKEDALLDALFKSVQDFFIRESALILSRRQNGSAETATELLESFVAREARNWVSKNTQSAKNPYQFFQKFIKDNPPGTLFSQ